MHDFQSGNLAKLPTVTLLFIRKEFGITASGHELFFSSSQSSDQEFSSIIPNVTDFKYLPMMLKKIMT